LTLSLGVAVGSSIVRMGLFYHSFIVLLIHSTWQQIALFVIPYVCMGCGDVWTDLLRSFIVTLGWILGKPMTLLFDPFESIVLFFSGEAWSPPSLRFNVD
jgi:hypothetical protein